MKKIFLLLILSISFSAYSQKEANFWYFGNKAALDFNSGSPVPVNSSKLNTFEGCSSFSNSEGELLFYVGAPNPNARNLTIWNRDNNPMPFSDLSNGGQTLKGDASSSQSALTVPAPNKDNIYYLFTVGAEVGSVGEKGFWYYTIDMTKDGGFGDITDAPIELHTSQLKSQWSEKVTAVRASTCNTFWVISYAVSNGINGQGKFFAYKVDENGVNINNPVISTIHGLHSTDPRGYLKVSPDGSKLVLANMTGGAFLFNFNDNTGQVTNYNNRNTAQLLDTDLRNAYGVEFSTSSKRLYVSTGNFNGANEYLYQFDVTKPNLAEVNNSRYTVHSYFNTRNALQLGPNGKIYWSSDRNTKISVINNPEELGVACNYSHQSVDLGKATASQGLPPFLSSLLLPIEIADSVTGKILNNQTEQNCVGESLKIIPEDVTAQTGSLNYEWSLNSTLVSNEKELILSNLATQNSGDYKLKVSLTDECGNATTLEGVFTLEVYEATSATQSDDVYFCDVDNDGFNDFDLQNDVTPQILNGQDPAVFEVAYFLSQTDADANTNALTNPYTNPTIFSNQTIYTRMHNIAAPNACYDTNSFTLAVTGNPTPQTPTDYEECDDSINGTDIDGFFNNFLLNTKDNEILGSLNPSVYEVSYHTTPAGANTDKNTDVIDKNTLYINSTANSQAIYVRVENKNNAVCYDASVSFNLVVNTLPIISNVAELKQCDNDTDAFSDFNLNEAQSNISSNYTNESFTFYPTLKDAENDTNSIINPSVFTNRTVTSDTVWVRTISNKNCFRISQVNLTVSTTGIPNTFQKYFTQCDDYLDIDGNDNTNNNDIDGVTSFDFSSVDSEIKALFTASGQKINISYYRNEADALAEANKIIDISNYRNIGYPNTQKIYVRVDSDLDNDCLGFGPHINLTVNAVPEANTVTNFNLCDDFDSGSFDDGKNTNIDLRSKVSDILGTSQSTADYTVTFHNSINDASLGNSPIGNINNYTNQIKDKETIYVRVENNTTNCFNANSSFDIIINPLPTITNTIPDLEICDVATSSDGDSRNRLAQNINLSERDVDVLNGRDPNLFDISYHRTRQDAINGISPLNKTNYSNAPNTTNFPANLLGDIPATEVLHISIADKNSGCRYGIATLQLIIYPEPNIPLNITNYTNCDNQTDNDTDDTNGINGDITLKNKTPEILVNYPENEHSNFTITFHESLIDAESGVNIINENQYENTANNQTIYVRVKNNKTNCINDSLTFDIIINPLPDFMVDTPVIVCLNNPQTRLEPISPSADYSYEWTLKGDPQILSNDNFYDVTTGGTYIVTATTKDGTGCSRSRKIEVIESINPTLTSDDIVIVDDTNNNQLNDYSIKIITENQNLGIGDYEFAIVDEENNMTGFQDEPLFENTTGGFYTVIVRDKNGCQPDASIEVSVIEYPKFLTPNGDGKNDTWKIKGANSSFYPSSNITVVDRHGKIVAIIPIDSEGWNGTYKGNTLPPNDYWFKIQLTDRNGKTHQHQGHFSLLRR